jgi:hypothetical protein
VRVVRVLKRPYSKTALAEGDELTLDYFYGEGSGGYTPAPRNMDGNAFWTILLTKSGDDLKARGVPIVDGGSFRGIRYYPVHPNGFIRGQLDEAGQEMLFVATRWHPLLHSAWAKYLVAFAAVACILALLFRRAQKIKMHRH